MKDASPIRGVAPRRALDHLRAADPVMAALIARYGPCRIRLQPADFASLARSIVFQQLNGRAAQVIWGRLAAALGAVTPENLLRIRLPRLRAAGLSARKCEYLRDLAHRTLSGEIDFAAFPRLPDDEVLGQLTRVKGIGPWTVHMFLIFSLGRPDVLPTGDLGLRAALRRLYSLPAVPSPPEMERIAQPWRPWATFACWYLWRTIDGDSELW